jgi:hypothetical protein
MDNFLLLLFFVLSNSPKMDPNLEAIPNKIANSKKKVGG